MAIDRTDPAVPRIVPARPGPAAAAELPRTTTLSRELSGLRFAATLESLDDYTVRAVTVAARQLLGLPMDEIIGRSILDLLVPEDRESGRAALDALRTGAIDFYMGHRHGLGTAHPSAGLLAWVHKIEIGGHRYALTRWREPGSLAKIRPQAVGAINRLVALLLVDGRGYVKAATIEEETRFRIDRGALVGKLVMPTVPLPELLADPATARARREGVTISGPVTVPLRGGKTVELQAVAAAWAGSHDWLVAILDLDPPPSREAELEGHLWRIAAELEASGILQHAGKVPQLALGRVAEAASLTPRQWEILRRLMAGERVPTTARELVISQSTVRNHLSAIFDRFGVHSQPELLERLSGSAAPGPSDPGRRSSGSSSETDGLSMA